MILALAFVIVDGLPSIIAGVCMLSTDKLPCTVNCPSLNCKNCPSDFFPHMIELAVTLPSGVMCIPEELISMLPPAPDMN